MDTEKYNILYVDDEPSNLNSLKNLFRKKFNIITTTSGKEGLEILESQRIDLIITDQRMPGMTGIEFLKKVKKRWPSLNCILLSAFAELEVMKEAINEVGIYWYLNKPFDPEQMEQTIIKGVEANKNALLLKESDEKFRSVFNSMIDVFTRSDMNGVCLIVSPSIYKMLGYKHHEVLGRDLADFYLDPNQRVEIINELRNTHDSKNFEIDLVKKDGTIIKVSSNAKMYYDIFGEPIGIDGNLRDITALKKTENELRKSELSFRSVFQSSPIAKLIVNNEGRIIQGNHEAEKIFGYSANELMGKPIEMLMPKQLRSIHKEHQKQFYKRPELRMMGKGLDLFALHKDGREFPVEIALKPMELEGKKVVLTVINDISERKQAEEKLRVSNLREKELADIVRDAPIAIAFGYPDGRLDNCNAAFCKLTGYTISELKHINWNDVLTPDKWKTAEGEMLSQLNVSGKTITYEKEYIHKNGDIVPIELLVTGEFDSEGNILYYIAFITDISERKQAQEILQESENRFRGTFEQAAVGIAHVSTDGRFLRINEKFCEIVGYNQDEMLSINFQKITHPEDLDNDIGHVQDLLNGEADSYFIEKRYIRKDGIVVWVNLTVNLLLRETSEPDYFISVVEDITDKKNVERKITEHQERIKKIANKLVINEEVIRRQIAVDLHDNVGQLLSSSRMQLARVLDMEENAEILIRLKNISQALRTAIQATRESIFNLSPPQLNEIGLYAAVHDWMQEHIDKKHDIGTSITTEGDIFDLDDNTGFLLFRSVRELITNVLKHARAHHIKVHFEQRENTLLISVEDDGAGFDYSPELLRLKRESYGLFSIQQRLLDLGGSLTINSVLTKGTIVTLSLPLKEDI